MDILKTLRRSTKGSSRNLSAQHASVPSGGATSNPQLFQDEVFDSGRGKKRKRGDGGTNGEAALPDASEDVDFFAIKTVSSKTKTSKPNENDCQLPFKQDQPAPTPLDYEECRRILKSHRLKMTLLPSGADPKLKPKKKSKKQKVDGHKDSKQGKYEKLFPQPLMKFTELRSSYGISTRLNENITNQGYTEPTEIQMASLPLLLQPEFALGAQLGGGTDGQKMPSIDLLAIAPTGSGKTLAFLIPIINDLLRNKRASNSDGVQAVVVAPTKELASQIVNEGRKLCIGTGIKVVGMQKGMRVVDPGDEAENAESAEVSSEDSESDEEEKEAPIKKSTQPLAKADILVTTPLKLLHALSHATKKEGLPLPSVRQLVLDEADVLLDPLFREQTLGILGACNNPELRVTLWSATMGSNIEDIAREEINARKERLGIQAKSVIIRLVVGLKDTAIPNVEQRLVYAATEQGKLIALRQLLRPTAQSAGSEEALRPPFLVFTQTKDRAVALHSELQYDIPAEAGGSSRIAVLHSDMSDSRRDQVMTRFRNGEIWVLITTDILSRGVDFKGINGVVNYDIPNSAADYIHRIGRTGRGGRNGGIAVTYHTQEDLPYVINIANVIAATEKQAGKADSECSVQKWLLAALPRPSKEAKKELKKHGVGARRSSTMEAKNEKTRISTKSGFGRKKENNRKGAIEASRRRKAMINTEQKEERNGSSAGANEGEWEGFGE